MSYQPKIFISSTIYDFRDLRSALKFYLESLGYQVLLSEFNDFTKPLDTSSYEACLHAVRSADYFILLIGGRAGGFYNRREKVSITRIEYRIAYELVRAGKMKLITFVREEVWNLREDRKALEKALAGDYKASGKLSARDMKRIVNHESSLISDPEAIFNFIREVSRAEEMKQATGDGGPFPVGNWIHVFANFQDVVEALRTEFNVGDRLGRLALVLNLERELKALVNLLGEHNQFGGLRSYIAVPQYTMAIAGEQDPVVSMEEQEFRALLESFYFVARIEHMLTTQFVDQALASGEFLVYDRIASAYDNSPVSNLLYELKQAVVQMKRSISDIRTELESIHHLYGRRRLVLEIYVIVIKEINKRRKEIIDLAHALLQALPRPKAPVRPKRTAPRTRKMKQMSQ